MINLNELNPEQRIAAETIHGPVLILAGAGSGKTRTVTYRISHMVNNLGIPGNSILGVSFTNKAAREMQERVRLLLGAKAAKGVTLSTFHSLCIRILKQEIQHIGYHRNFTIYDQADQMGIVRIALKHFNNDKNFDKKVILAKIGFLKNRNISEMEFANSEYFDPESAYDHATQYTYEIYQEKLRFFNAIDFDDIILLTVKLFREHPQIAEKYSQKYRYIMIDEYQDTNALQFALIDGLTSTHKNLCVVGDDDQSIYAFRGADIANILNFEKKFSGAKVIKLEENYRSTTPILNLANQVIAENKNRTDKRLWSRDQSTEKPLLWACGNADHEAEIVVDDITKSLAAGDHLGEIAILYRSNTQAPAIEDQLRMAQIPYRILGGQKFYEKKEVKDLIAYLSLCFNPLDEMALRRILNVPNRGIGIATLNKYIALAASRKTSLYQTLESTPDLAPLRRELIEKFTALTRKYQEKFRGTSIVQPLTELIEEIQFTHYIARQYDDNPKQGELRKNDVKLFIESAARFESYYQGQTPLKSFMEKILLADNQDIKNDAESAAGEKNEVTMMTLHSSKGLEFNHVYLVGMEEEFLPHKRTIRAGEDIAEERRLAYVGITRARKKLIMTYCKERKIYGKDQACFKSRFINQLSLFFTEQDRTTFGHLAPQEIEDYKKDFFSGLQDILS